MAKKVSSKTAAAMKMAPNSASAFQEDPDKYFMARQPISLVEQMLLQSEHMRPLTEQENAAFSQIPPGTKQVVLKLTIPIVGMELKIGIANLSSLGDYEQVIKLPIDPQQNKWSQTTTRSIRREELFEIIQFFLSLDAMRAGLIQTCEAEENEYETARELLRHSQEKFKQRAPWMEFSGSGTNPNFKQALFATFMENVWDQEHTTLDAIRLWKVCRGDNPELELLIKMRKTQEFLVRRFSEERSHLYHIGHNPDTMKDSEKDEFERIKSAEVEVAVEQENHENQARMTDYFAPQDNPVAAAAGNGNENALDNQIQAELRQKERQKRAAMQTEENLNRRFGINWKLTPKKRRNNVDSLLTTVEKNLINLLPINWVHSGMTLSNMESLLNYLWKGDHFKFTYAPGRKALPPKVTVSERGYGRTGLLQEAFCPHDATKNLFCSHDPHTNRYSNFQPAAMFPAHNLTNWVSGVADTVQVCPANYFSLPYRLNHEGERASFPKQRVQDMLRKQFDEAHEWCRFSASQAPMKHDLACATLLGGAASPSQIGARFKGFPHPERVYVLSPMLSLPCNASLIPLVPPPTRIASPTALFTEEDHFFYVIQELTSIACPKTPADFAAFNNSSTQTMLFGDAEQIKELLSTPGVVTTLSTHLATLIAQRIAIRHIIVMSDGMMREWDISDMSKKIRQIGSATLAQVAPVIKEGPLDDYDILGAELTYAASDTYTVEEWAKFLRLARTCLSVRMSHLERSLAADTAFLEVSPFTKKVQSLMSIVPWKTSDKMVQASKKMHMEANSALWQTINDDNSDTAASKQTMWRHRVITGKHGSDGGDSEPMVLTGCTINGNYVPIHCGWKPVGDLGISQLDDIKKLRRCTNWNDFITEPNRNLLAFTAATLVPFMHYVEQKYEDRNRNPDIKILIRSIVTAKHQIEEFSMHLVRNNYRPLIMDGHHCTRNVNGVSVKSSIGVNNRNTRLPEAFANISLEWHTNLGKVANVASVPLEECTNQWQNVTTLHSTMLAIHVRCLRALGVARNGTIHMLPVALAIRRSITAACILRDGDVELQGFNLLIPGGTAGGKTTTMNLVKETCVSGTCNDLGSFSSKAMQTEKNHDGMALICDEGVAGVQGDPKKQDGELGALLKRMMTSGEDSREVLMTGDGTMRETVKIVSSHRRPFIWNSNMPTSNITAPLLARFWLTLVPSLQSVTEQPLGQTVGARSGIQAAQPSGDRKSEKERAAKFLQMQHCAKGITEMFIQGSALKVESESMVTYAHALVAPLKAKMDGLIAAPRVLQYVSLLIRNEVTDASSTAIWFKFKELLTTSTQYSTHSRVPFEFILKHSAPFLFATQSMAVFVESLLYKDVDDGVAQDIFLELKNQPQVKTEAEKALYLTVPVPKNIRSQTDLSKPDQFSIKDCQHVLWWDDPQTKANQAMDLNYIVIDLDASTRSQIYSKLRDLMKGNKYSTVHIKDALSAMCARMHTITEKNDCNVANAPIYNRILNERVLAMLKYGLDGRGGNGNNSGEDPKPGGKKGKSTKSADHKADYAALALEASKKLVQQKYGSDLDGTGFDDDEDGGNFGSGVQHFAADPTMNLQSMATLREAAQRRLPLRRYQKNEMTPLVKIWQIPGHSRNDSKWMLAILREPFKQMTDRFDTASNDTQSLPVISILLNALLEQLNLYSPVQPYPSFIKVPATASTILQINAGQTPTLTETVLTSYPLSQTGNYISAKVQNAINHATTAVGLDAIKMNPELADFLAQLPEQLVRENSRLCGPAPLEISYSIAPGQRKRKLILYNELAQQDTDFGQGQMEQELLYQKLPTFQKMESIESENVQLYQTNGPVENPDHLQEVLENRYLALTFDLARIKLKINQQNRAIQFNADWDSYFRHCINQVPMLDPCDPKNYKALPLVWLPGMSETKAIKHDNKYATDIYPASDVERQFKSRLYSAFFRAFPEQNSVLVRLDPKLFTGSTSEWMVKVVQALAPLDLKSAFEKTREKYEADQEKKRLENSKQSKEPVSQFELGKAQTNALQSLLGPLPPPPSAPSQQPSKPSNPPKNADPKKSKRKRAGDTVDDLSDMESPVKITKKSETKTNNNAPDVAMEDVVSTADANMFNNGDDMEVEIVNHDLHQKDDESFNQLQEKVTDDDVYSVYN